MFLVDGNVSHYGIWMFRLSLIQLAITAAILAPTLLLADDPIMSKTVVIYREPGRYGGWPANQGMWQWDDEIVVGFKGAWYKAAKSGHAVDPEKPSELWQARSIDGGLTWKVETGLPFSDRKNEGVPLPLTEPIDFCGSDFALMFRFKSLHTGPSRFYTSSDRCRTWNGPFEFEVEGVENVATRTDLVVLGPLDCLMLGSCAKQTDNKEGRVFCARTMDGGLNWKLVSFIGDEPAEGGFAIMPSTIRLPGGALLTVIRMGKPEYNIVLWRSDDLGQTWVRISDVTGDIGGNPPATILLPDGRVGVTYGSRRPPYGIRARLSKDEGRTWGGEVILRDDGLTGDLGYPRSLVRPDGRILTVYYFNGPRDEDRSIEGTFWTPSITD